MTGLLSFTVGEPTPQPDPAYTINATGTPVLINGATLEDGDTLVMPQASSRAIVHFEVDIPASASLDITVTDDFFEGATAAGWNVSLIPPAVTINPPFRAQVLDFDIRATASATSGFVSLTFTNNIVPATVQSRAFALRTN